MSRLRFFPLRISSFSWSRIVAATALVASLAGPAALGQNLQGGQIFQTMANSYYKKKQYIPAAAQYMEAWRVEPENATAAYYAAYCLYMGGRKDDAIKTFWLVVDKFPNRKEGQNAKAFLQRIDPAFNRHGGDARKALASSVVPASSGSSSTAARSAGSGARTSEKKSLSNEQLVKSMLEIHKPRGKIPAVSDSFVKGVEGIMVALPRYVLLMMHDRNARIHLVPALVETDYRMQNVRPRGYSEGSSWQNSNAMCSGRNLYIAQYKLDSRSGNYVTAATEIGSIRHETGHCIDHCLGYISQQDKFRHPYRLAAARVPAEDRQRMDYFLQVASGGSSETFAELCCARFGGETDEWRIKTCSMVKSYFKEPDAIIGSYLKQIEEKYKDD
ncbi:MAG: hypothetical protein R3F51_12955 [Cyanobacteriota/Melainabacteria group bacterium]